MKCHICEKKEAICRYEYDKDGGYVDVCEDCLQKIANAEVIVNGAYLINYN